MCFQLSNTHRRNRWAESKKSRKEAYIDRKIKPGCCVSSLYLFVVWTRNGLFNPTVMPFNIYLFKVNDRNIRKRCEIYSKLTKKVLLTLNIFHTFSSNYIVYFEYVITGLNEFVQCRDVFITLPNIYGRTFQQKWITYLKPNY